MHFEPRLRTGLSLLGLFLLIIFILPVSAQKVDTKQIEPISTAKANLLQANELGLRFSLQTPSYTSNSDGAVSVEGLSSRLSDVGAPDLPFYTTFVVLPPEATAVVKLQERGIKETTVAYVQPVPKRGIESMNVDPQALEAIGLDSSNSGEIIFEKDMAVYSRNALYPATNFSVSEPMYLRDVRLVELHIYPLRYNPGTNTVTQATEVEVTVTFNNAQGTGQRPLPDSDDTHLRQISAIAINAQQASNWRSLPAHVANMPGTKLPVGVNTYKIEITEDGIYEISGQELAAQGMNLAAVNPATIEMLHRGQPVAYQFIDQNSNNQFDPTDAVRFYGWTFDGPRAEKMFVSNNVFWLWAGGTATAVETIANTAGNGYPIATTFTSSITKEPEIYNASTWNDNWDNFPNDPDNYYWDYIPQTAPNPALKTYTIDLPNPAAGATNSYIVEFLSREYSLAPNYYTYTVQSHFNSSAQNDETSWIGIRNHNLNGSVSATDLKQLGESGYPTNDVNLSLNSSAISGLARFYLNRITVEYLRNLIAVNDELIFSDSAAGNREFQLNGYNENDAQNVLVWDISEPTSPKHINLQAQHISGTGPYIYQIGSQHNANAQFITTTKANIKSVAGLTLYVPKSLDAPDGGAKWIAVSHNDFLSAANTLATHRNSTMSTFVADVEDVINQYGYGLNTPGAIRDYLAYAIGNWSKPPGYVTLIGDATINPRNLDCPPSPVCDSGWDKDEKTYVVTDISFTDRYQGLVPSDYPMTLLSGDDILPDIALGRLTAQTVAEANTMVQNIITYEQDRSGGFQDWQQNILFVADNKDNGGDFCPLNEIAGQSIPDDYNQIHLCLPEPANQDEQDANTEALRNNMKHWINDVGISILNYRGHGSVQSWASNPNILSINDTDFWLNDSKPIIILSADCLDGYFARPNLPGLGETVFKGLSNKRGSAAHWSATGLGFTYEHSVLHEGFYNGIFEQNMFRIGDAVTAAKLTYIESNYHRSELYGFILLGDPAMIALENKVDLYLPAILKP